MDWKGTESTRYLCAAIHLDRGICDQVVRELVDEEYRAIAPAHGVDLETVVTHALAGQRRRFLRDALLALLLLPVIAMVLAADDPMAGLQSSPWLVCGLLAWVVMAAEAWISRYSIVARRLSRGTFDPEALPLRLAPRTKAKIEQLGDFDDSNVVVYSGFSPFVGSGIDVGGWSFALDVSKGKEQMSHRLEPAGFAVTELYDAISRAIVDLNIDGASIAEKLYVNGRDIRGDARFLPSIFGRPRAVVDPALMSEFVHSPTKTVRHYKCVRVVDWSGELVLSVFLRFSRIAQNLFVEASYFLLTPLREDYHRVDSLEARPSLRTRIRLVVEAGMATPFAWLVAPLRVAATLLHPAARWWKRRQMRRTILEDRAFDYGAATSIRQTTASDVYRRYFQKLDKEMHIKVIERRILDAIIDFLDERKIDTSDLRERQTTILNNGVIVSGGSIQTEGMAVGRGARALVGRLRNRARAPRGEA